MTTRQEKIAILGEISPIFCSFSADGTPIRHFSAHMFIVFGTICLFPPFLPIFHLFSA